MSGPEILETLNSPAREAALVIREHVHPLGDSRNHQFKTDDLDPQTALNILPGMYALGELVDTESIDAQEVLGVPKSIFHGLLGATAISAGVKTFPYRR